MEIEMDIEIYKKLCHDETIVMTRHARQRLVERNIALDDVEQTIRTGRIIEEYPNDTPFPSCLILGDSGNHKPLHIVVSTDNEFLYIITAYHPDPQKWAEDFSVRKEPKR